MHETDKIGHGYGPTYEMIASTIGSYPRVLEIGTANGDGLRYFYELFRPSLLVGVDINRHSSNLHGPMLHYAQDDPDLPAHLPGKFDLIVDDASHDDVLTRRTLSNLWPLVAAGGGYYVIEDWSHAGMICGPLASAIPGWAFEEAAPLLPGVKTVTYSPGLIVIEKR